MRQEATSPFNWRDKTVLVTGGTGSFGRTFAKLMLAEFRPAKLIIFSRDELKQHQMQTDGFSSPTIRYFIGDVRDKERLHRAFRGVDVIVHAAALKQVPACEYNPLEAIQTNVMGAKNVIEVALDAGVGRVVALSTDKAVNPVNLYGATKLCAEKLFIHANAYAGKDPMRFSVVRYGNVVGSRGSVLPIFLEQKQSGRLTVTDERMTRFWITLEQGVRFAIRCTEQMQGREIFIPKISSLKVVDLAKMLAPECKIEFTGIRPGEKIHELLMSEDEARHSIELDKMYVVLPEGGAPTDGLLNGKPVPDGFRYSSQTNSVQITREEIMEWVAKHSSTPDKMRLAS